MDLEMETILRKELGLKGASEEEKNLVSDNIQSLMKVMELVGDGSINNSLLQQKPPDNKSERIISPSRTYVAICNKGNWDGHYFRKFKLPHVFRYSNTPTAKELINNAAEAACYYVNVLDAVSCISGVYSWEDFQNIRDTEDVLAERELASAEDAIESQAKKEQKEEHLFPDFSI